MISKNQAKNLRALHRKKERQQQGLFLVEGEKVVAELLQSNWRVEQLFATEKFLTDYQALLTHAAFPIIECSAESLSAVSTLRTNNAALAVVQAPEAPTQPPWFEQESMPTRWTLALDDINDPGNLGSLLRIADWYGIRDVVCSPHTVEHTNPKVITASKGSFLRVNVHALPLDAFFHDLPPHTPVLGAFLEGESIHTLAPTPQGGVILLGSEAQGIADVHEQHVTRKITIPSYGDAESLNVSVAAAIICDNLARMHHT